jgi:hypothetical protein
MLLHDKPPSYQAYLLRCWRERDRRPGGAECWRFTLEDPHTGERRGFVGLDSLVAFLETAMQCDPEEPARR